MGNVVGGEEAEGSEGVGQEQTPTHLTPGAPSPKDTFPSSVLEAGFDSQDKPGICHGLGSAGNVHFCGSGHTKPVSSKLTNPSPVSSLCCAFPMYIYFFFGEF